MKRRTQGEMAEDRQQLRGLSATQQIIDGYVWDLVLTPSGGFVSVCLGTVAEVLGGEDGTNGA